MHVDKDRYIIMSQLFSSGIISTGRAEHHNAEFMMQHRCVHYDIVQHYNMGEGLYNIIMLCGLEIIM
jgi:hypothetical protein